MGQKISLRCVKRHRAKSSREQRKTVDISDDTWLEALKFLICPQWSQQRIVCRRINAIVKRNISRLPKMVIDSADMYFIYETPRILEFLELNKYTVIHFDKIMQEKQSVQWLRNRGFTLEIPEDIPAKVPAAEEIAFYGKGRKWNNNVNVCILGSEHHKIELSAKERHFPWFHRQNMCQLSKPILYFAQFQPVMNQHSGAYLAQFLRFIYHPTSYIKCVDMFAVNQNFFDSFKCNIDSVGNEPRYIKCESFSVQTDWSESAFAFDLFNLMKWLARNVRAEKICIPRINSIEAFVLLANFLLDPSGAKQCASKKIKIKVSDGVAFLNSMIEKFHLIPHVESSIPKIVIKHPLLDELSAHLGPNLIGQEVESERAAALYILSNGQNRMRITFYDYVDDNVDSKCHVRIYSI